ncbi:MAG: hypothetical protein U0V49_13180 [Saprospiraceae bacterium]
MRCIILILVLIFCSNWMNAQVGYQLDFSRHAYQLNGSSSNSPNESLHSLGGEIGIQYWWRLKNRRVEFTPGFHIATDIGRKNSFQNYNLTNIQAALLVPVQIYPLSFKDDCNCPTFKKQGTFFKKGLHFIVQPGLSVNRRNIAHDSIATSDVTITVVLGIGAGLDIGLNRSLTLTPFVLYQIYLNDKIMIDDHTVLETGHNSIHAGLRLRIHQSKSRF